MKKHEIMIITDYSQYSAFTLKELCEICNISIDVVHDFIDFEIIHPKQKQINEWVFDLEELQRIKMALRLQHDLEVNLSGVALVLELLDELKKLREQNKLLEKYLNG